MPNYDYECQKCGHIFEVFQSMSDKRLTNCPRCKGKVKRLLGTGAGIIFKGTGFYETDYKRKSGGASGEGSAASTSAKPENKSTATVPSPAKSEK